MITPTIQRQYNEVIAAHYDRDPQGVIQGSLDRAIAQLETERALANGVTPLNVLDVGMGTGLFLARLLGMHGHSIQPYGLDLSEKMVSHARGRIPDLIAEVADAAQLEEHFGDQTFDCICTHFLTGFVPIGVLAPQIWARLREGGYWSLVGGTRKGFPVLEAKGNSKLIRRVLNAGEKQFDGVTCIPADTDAVVRELRANGFEACAAETFEPPLAFGSFDEFLEFAYLGGWLTPIIESFGLHKLGALPRWLLNRLVFPVKDHHSIAVVLARKVAKGVRP